MEGKGSCEAELAVEELPRSSAAFHRGERRRKRGRKRSGPWAWPVGRRWATACLPTGVCFIFISFFFVEEEKEGKNGFLRCLKS